MQLSNQARVDEQLSLESLSVEMGVAKYREALAQGGHADVPAGSQLIRAAIRPMEEAIQNWLKETSEGLASRGAASSYHFVNQLEPVAIAWLTAQAAIGLLHERPAASRVATVLSMSIEAAVNIEAICKANPKLGAKVAKRAEAMTANNKLIFIRKGAEMVDVKAFHWDDKARLRIGLLLLTMFSQCTGLVTVETLQLGPKRKETLVRPTESCLKWLEISHARCELLNPSRLPMVCRPRSWTNPFNGGYLTKQLRQPLVKTRNRGYLSELKEWDMPHVYAAVNALQDTEWSVNEGIYVVIKGLWEKGDTAGVLPNCLDIPLPAKSWGEGETPEEATLHSWKVEAARIYEGNAKLLSKRLQLVQKLWIAEMMLERGNKFHYVYNLDWRGRLYPVGPSLTPQGDDVAKALLTFSKDEMLGEEGAFWLAVHGANSYGIDKVSFEERIEWVETNTERILAAANGCTSATDFWTQADSPFVFLAFCMEWAKLQKWVDAGLDQSAFRSNLPVAFDGACNGLQNFSAMLRDEVGGAATGLIPGEKPADIYSEVARATQAIIDRDAHWAECPGTDSQRRQRWEVATRWVGKMSRKLAKRNTMTVPYGVTKRGMKDQLFGELRSMVNDGEEVSALPSDAEYLAECNFEAIGTVVVAARRAMDWLREVASVAARNQLPVRWTTPIGLLVVQDYRMDEGDRVDFTVLGRRYRLVLQRTGDKLNTRKQSLGISPNFVHSLDAAHLMRTVLFCTQDGMQDFAMIHDSYGCHAGHAALLRSNLRDAFIEQYSTPVLEQFRSELCEQLPVELREELPVLPEYGTLDLEQIRTSDYFFA